MPSPIISVILAAGESRRMGSPKALLPLEGSSFVRRIIDAHRDAGVDEIVVVLGAYAAEIRAHLNDAHVVFAMNERFREGQLTSVIAGIEEAQRMEASAAIIHPVDHPLVASDTVRAVRDTFLFTGRAIVRPRCGGRHGHPVVFGATLFDALRNAPIDRGARHVVHVHAEEIVNVDTADTGVLANIDTPEDYEHLREDLHGVA